MTGFTLLAVPSRRWLFLAAFAAATVLLIPLESYLPGAACWLAAAAALARDPDPAARRRLGVLLGTIALLAAAPIHTGLSNRHFLHLGAFFLAVVVGPAAILARTDPGVIEFRFWPRRLRWQDVVYTLLSIPLSYAVFGWWFFHADPGLAGHWPLPLQPDREETWRLIVGINCVGVWDELFFLNTVYATLRSLFPRRLANAAQAVVYTSVLYDMAFTGIGPLVVGVFALTQGAMYEGSRSLLWVLIVHLVVDFFLVGAILQQYYGPGFSKLVF